MKKNYELPEIKKIIFTEDVVRCSTGITTGGANGDDWITDGKELPTIQ